MIHKTKSLMHPVLRVPAIADVVGDWMKNGRYHGLELQFPDGHRVKMSFSEIGEAQAALETEAAEVVK